MAVNRWLQAGTILGVMEDPDLGRNVFIYPLRDLLGWVLWVGSYGGQPLLLSRDGVQDEVGWAGGGFGVSSWTEEEVAGGADGAGADLSSARSLARGAQDVSPE